MTDTPADLAALLRGLDQRIPRYTSYPTADRFHAAVGESEYRAAVREGNSLPLPPALSLYLHVPFCHSLCYYCGCNKVVTQHFRKAAIYLDALFAEVAWHGGLFDSDRRVDQLHLGGGTPTFLSDTQLRRLMDVLDANFNLEHGAEREFSIELDPRTMDDSRAGSLLGMGFNRFSLGIQDFDRAVQERINRVQPYAMVASLVDALRRDPGVALSFDLIYGLPLQTPAGFLETIRKTVELAPERIAIYRYAHLPERFKAQRLLEDDRPDLDARIEMFAAARNALLEAGYVAIGLDHFARPDDELAIAWKDGTLHRNFQGYSTRGGRDLVGVGPSAIGSVQDCFIQNAPRIADWQSLVLAGTPAFQRGFVREEDDCMRAQIIQDVMCRARVDLDRIARRWGLDPELAFADELHRLDALADRELVRLRGFAVEATEQGLLALRQIAAVFDRYLQADKGPVRYSQAV